MRTIVANFNKDGGVWFDLLGYIRKIKRNNKGVVKKQGLLLINSD